MPRGQRGRMMVAPMVKDSVRDRGSPPPALLLKGKLVSVLPVVLWFTLALAALWRLALAWQVLDFWCAGTIVEGSFFASSPRIPNAAETRASTTEATTFRI